MPRRPRSAGALAARRLAPALAAALAIVLAAAGGCRHHRVPNLDSAGTTIVCFGDSITAGVGSAGKGTYPERLSALLGVPVVNAGVPGDTAGDGRARLAAVLARDPWLVIVEFGGNDLLRQVPAKRTEADLRAVVEGVLDAGAVPMLVAVDNPVPLIGARLGDLYDRLGERYGVPVVGGVLREILADRALKSDEIHPNPAGYARLAEAVAAKVRPLLAERRRRGFGGAGGGS
jgi:acyl-CoA thioesterase I